MFVLEISFQDGVSQPEMVFVRRPQALIGSSDYAHVVIEDMASLGYQLRLVKDIGRSFRCKPVGSPAGNVSTFREGTFCNDYGAPGQELLPRAGTQGSVECQNRFLAGYAPPSVGWHGMLGAPE